MFYITIIWQAKNVLSTYYLIYKTDGVTRNTLLTAKTSKRVNILFFIIVIDSEILSFVLFEYSVPVFRLYFNSGIFKYSNATQIIWNTIKI